ncbi:MAG: response regulator [Rhodothermia bacterium]|nr:response regulator [Rhodothermia bacterium]
MADSAYEIKETVRELEERATFESRKSVLNRITALKLYRLFVEADEPNPIEYAANAVGVKTASVEKWLEIYKKSGLGGLLASGQSGQPARRGAQKSRRSAPRRRTGPKQRKMAVSKRASEEPASSAEGQSADPAEGSSQPYLRSPVVEAEVEQSARHSDIGQSVPDGEQSAPEIEQSAPDIERLAQDIEQLAPDIEQLAQEIEQLAPDIEQLALDIEQLAPDIGESTPGPEHSGPDTEHTDPIPEQTAPGIEQSAAVIGQSDPDSAQPTPDIEDLVQDIRQSAPDGESGHADSHVADATTEQDYGASFYSQVSASKVGTAEPGSDTVGEESLEAVDAEGIETHEDSASVKKAEKKAENRATGYRESLSRTARRARLRARVSRRAISRLRRPRATNADGGAGESEPNAGLADAGVDSDEKAPESPVVVPELVGPTTIPELLKRPALPKRPNRDSEYRPKRKYAASSGHAFANARVLIAEPDDLITDIIRHRLEKQGAKVTSAIDGVEVVSRFWSTTFDLVIVAAALPGLDGFEIARWLRDHQTNSEVPILITSWPGNESDLVRAFDAGADDFLRKPFSPAEMVARSRRLLERVGGWDPIHTDEESTSSDTESRGE